MAIKGYRVYHGEGAYTDFEKQQGEDDLERAKDRAERFLKYYCRNNGHIEYIETDAIEEAMDRVISIEKCDPGEGVFVDPMESVKTDIERAAA